MTGNDQAAIASYLESGGTITRLPPGIAAHGWAEGVPLSKNPSQAALGRELFDKNLSGLDFTSLPERKRGIYRSILTMSGRGIAKTSIAASLNISRKTVRAAIDWMNKQRAD